MPGIAIDEQRRRYSIDKFVLAVARVLAVGFVIWGIVATDSVGVVANAAYGWVMEHLGWLFNAVATIVLVTMLVLAFTRYGKIPLGKDEERPEFSTFSWVAMLFAAGLGIGVMFWGPRSMTYFLSPPPLTNEPESTEPCTGPGLNLLPLGLPPGRSTRWWAVRSPTPHIGAAHPADVLRVRALLRQALRGLGRPAGGHLRDHRHPVRHRRRPGHRRPCRSARASSSSPASPS